MAPSKPQTYGLDAELAGSSAAPVPGDSYGVEAELEEAERLRNSTPPGGRSRANSHDARVPEGGYGLDVELGGSEKKNVDAQPGSTSRARRSLKLDKPLPPLTAGGQARKSTGREEEFGLDAELESGHKRGSRPYRGSAKAALPSAPENQVGLDAELENADRGRSPKRASPNLRVREPSGTSFTSKSPQGKLPSLEPLTTPSKKLKPLEALPKSKAPAPKEEFGLGAELEEAIHTKV